MIRELEAVRKAAQLKKRLWQEYQALLPTPQSPKLDGMPHAGGGVDGYTDVIKLREEALERHRAAEAAFAAAESAARRCMGRLTPWLYSLCLYYYIGGMGEKDVQRVMGISESTFKRYRSDLQKYEP